MHFKIPVENSIFFSFFYFFENSVFNGTLFILSNFVNSMNFVYGIFVKLQNSVGGFSIMTLWPLRLKRLSLPKEIHFSKLQTSCVMELKRKTLG